MPAPQQSVFLQARRPSCRPTNSVKALKAFGLVRGSNSKAYRRPGRAEILVPGSSRGDIDIGSCLQCCYTTVNSSWGPDTHRYLRDNHTTIAPPLVHRQVVMKSYIAGGCPRNFPLPAPPNTWFLVSIQLRIPKQHLDPYSYCKAGSCVQQTNRSLCI